MELLDKNNYGRLVDRLKQVKINNLFARSVIEKKISGKVFVDNIENPKTFYVVHPYGMSLLFGDSQNPNFNNKFLDYSLNLNKMRDRHEWMQAYPGDWHKVLSELYCNCMIKSEENKENTETGIIELNTRINFKFNREKYILKKAIKNLVPPENIYRKKMGFGVPIGNWFRNDLKNLLSETILSKASLGRGYFKIIFLFGKDKTGAAA